MFGVPVLSVVFVVVVVGASLSLMAWLLAGIPELQTRPIRLVTDLDLEPDREVEIDLDDPRPREAVCP